MRRTAAPAAAPAPVPAAARPLAAAPRATRPAETTRVGAGTPRYLRSPAVPLTLQREGDNSSDGTAPDWPKLQLSTPSLLQPSDPYARFRPDLGLHLTLDEDLRAKVLAMAATTFDPAAMLAQVQAAAVAPSGSTAPSASTPVAAPNTAPASPAAPATGLDPDFVKTQRPATGGDALGAITKVPQVSQLLDRIGDDALGRLGHHWSASGTGERVAFVSGSVFVAGSILAPVFAVERSRDAVFSLLNDTVLPVPKAGGLFIEFHVAGDGLLLGAHLDLGRFTPDAWGFGGGKPKSFSDPAWRAIPPQIDREADGGAGVAAPTAAVGEGIAQRITEQRGQGAALDAALCARLEPALGADLSPVRVHTGPHADTLARSMQARAFTSGPDIFFRDGRYDPTSAAGRRLLAHEVVHTVQQANGPVDARPAGGGLRVGEPGDRHEQEAQRLGDQLSDRLLAPGPALRRDKPAAAAPAIQREPDGGKAAENSAEALLAKAPPLWNDYFDEVVPATAEAAEANDKIGLQRALWLITQAYGEQSPGVAGLPSAHRNRLFNEQAAATFKPDGSVDQVVPGQESEGVTLKKLNQNEGAKRGTTAMKVSATFGYDTPERAVKHHLEQMAARWKPASAALLAGQGSFEGFAHALKDAHYAKAEDYDTVLISLKNQVRSQVEAWLPYTIAQRRLLRLPRLQVYAEQARAAYQTMAGSLGGVAGLFMVQLQVLQALAELTEQRLHAERAALARLERFAQVLGVKVPH